MAKKMTETAAKSPRPARASKSKKSAAAERSIEVDVDLSASPAMTDTDCVVPQIDTEAVRARAYALWLAGGGSSMDNWLRAERELQAVAST